MRLRRLSGLWRVLTTAAPTRGESKITDVTTQFQQTLQVFSNKKADEAAERASIHKDSPACKAGHVSHVKIVSGPTIKGVVTAHRMWAALLEHIHIKEYLIYWQTRTRAGAWADDTDVRAHITACKRARKASQILHNSAAVFKGMNDPSPTMDRMHRRNHKYRAEEPTRASA